MHWRWLLRQRFGCPGCPNFVGKTLSMTKIEMHPPDVGDNTSASL